MNLAFKLGIKEEEIDFIREKIHALICRRDNRYAFELGRRNLIRFLIYLYLNSRN